MKADYEKLVEILKKYYETGELENLSFYTGNVNGKYAIEYNKDQKEVLDTIISDGAMQRSPEDYEVVDASYVCVTRYRNDSTKDLSSRIEKIELFIDKECKDDLIFYMVQQDLDFYQKVFKQSNNKGDISDYKNDDSKGLKIFPSKELIEDNLAIRKTRVRHM